MTDTGSFHYSNATAEAFEVGSRLVNYGAKPDFIGSMIYEQETLSHLKLLGLALTRLTVENGVAYSYITVQDFIKHKANEEDTDGIVDYMRKFNGADTVVFFKEKGNDVRVSLRGKEGVNVKEIAEEFGGGGHVLAAGCTVNMSLEESIKTVLARIEKRRKRI
jgi:phosphoesterase RecJ-like protein